MLIAIVLCSLSFVICLSAGRRSLIWGLVAVAAVGYFYGIVRANVNAPAAHFIFDAGVVGLYAALVFRPLGHEQQYRMAALKAWVGLLIIWPLLLFFIPLQDPLVQLVGLRGNIFLLPFLLLGAQLQSHDRCKLAVSFAVLNLVAFGFGVAEFFIGVPQFFPRNEVTELIYKSKDIANFTAYRIPATFGSAHAYAGTMVLTLPLLIGALVRKWRVYLMICAISASLMGVLMSGARVHFVVAALVVMAASFSLRKRLGSALGWLILLVCIGWVASNQERLQRFAQLKDPEVIVTRLSSSVNMGFMDAAAQYPLGNGLGGGGTSVPYFLRDRIYKPISLENEYARIMLEQGIIGLFFWVTFIGWLLTRHFDARRDPWRIGRRLAWCTCAAYFSVGVIGTGLLTSIPQTSLFLLLAGWIAVSPLPAQTTAVSQAPPQSDRSSHNIAEQYV